MTRIALVLLGSFFAACILLGVYFLKDSYMLLPVQDGPVMKTAPFVEWQDYSAPGKFQVSFPAMPQRATQNIVDQKTKAVKTYDMYVAQTNEDAIYMVSLIKFKEMKDTPDNILKSVVNDMLATNPQNAVKEMNLTQYQNYPAIDFIVENPETIVDGKGFIKDDTLYILSTIFKAGLENRDDYRHFLSTFKLANP